MSTERANASVDRFVNSAGTIFIEAEASLRAENVQCQELFDESLDLYVQMLIDLMQERRMKCFGRSIMFKVRDGTGRYDRFRIGAEYG